MKKLLGLGAIAGAAMLMSGCLVAPVIPPTGIVFSSFKAPLDFDQENSPMGNKEGTAETMSILGLVALGDASIRTAAESGGITTVYGADYEYFNVLGVIQRFKIIVHGE